MAVACYQLYYVNIVYSLCTQHIYFNAMEAVICSCCLLSIKLSIRAGKS